MIRIGTDCSGIDAPVVAIKALGIPYEQVFACEADEDARITLLLNHTPGRMYTDMSAERPDLPDMDVYCAGPPCQPFSRMGKRGGSEQAGGTLLDSCIDVIIRKRPKIFILENVRGLITVQGGTYWKHVCERLDGLGDYNWSYRFMNTRDYGLPQNRPRVYIVGIRADCQLSPYEPPPVAPMKSLDEIIDPVDENPPIRKSRFSEKTLNIIERDQNMFVNLSYPYKRGAPPVRDYCKCVLANSGLWNRRRNRLASVKEYLRLQGFPDNYRMDGVGLTSAKKQIGNAMSVCVVGAVLKAALKSIGVVAPDNVEPQINM